MCQTLPSEGTLAKCIVTGLMVLKRGCMKHRLWEGYSLLHFQSRKAFKTSVSICKVEVRPSAHFSSTGEV